jgi:predicted nucleotidyltransferase
MKSQLQIEIPRGAVADFCRRWQVTEFSLFGSVLRDDFRPDSDIDALVKFEPGTRHSVFDLMRMKKELAETFGRKVDLVDRGVVEASPNYIRRRHILESAEVVWSYPV